MRKERKEVSRDYRIHQYLEIAAEVLLKKYRELQDLAQNSAAELVFIAHTEATDLASQFYNKSPEKATADNVDDYQDDERSPADVREIKAAREILKKFNITGVKDPFVPVYEDGYIKFMSYGGVSDEQQCTKFITWLKKKKFVYKQVNERGISLGNPAQREVERLWK